MKYITLCITFLALFLSGCGKKDYTKLSGKDIYSSSCKSCHGNKGKKRALGKSQIIASWSEKNLAYALKGYKKGTYGGGMKSTMVEEVRYLSEKNLEDLARYIVSLNK